MSVEAFGWVLNNTPHISGTAKVVLLGIANHADPDGRNAWPAVARLAVYAGVSERSVSAAISALTLAGDIVVQTNSGVPYDGDPRHRPNRYTITGMQPGGAASFTPPPPLDPVDNPYRGVQPASPLNPQGVKLSALRGEAGRAQGVKPASPKPSFNRPEPSSSSRQPAVDNSERSEPEEEDEPEQPNTTPGDIGDRTEPDVVEEIITLAVDCLAHWRTGPMLDWTKWRRKVTTDLRTRHAIDIATGLANDAHPWDLVAATCGHGRTRYDVAAVVNELATPDPIGATA